MFVKLETVGVTVTGSVVGAVKLSVTMVERTSMAAAVMVFVVVTVTVVVDEVAAARMQESFDVTLNETWLRLQP